MVPQRPAAGALVLEGDAPLHVPFLDVLLPDVHLVTDVIMSFRVPWSLGNLNLVDYFPEGSQAF